MKKTYKYLSTIALSGLVCLFLGSPASAQRGSNGGGSRSSSGGGGGGGSRSSGGGGGGGGFRPSSSGSSVNSYRPSATYSRPSSGGFRPSAGATVNSYRPSASNPRVAIAPARINSQGIRPPVNRVGVFNGQSHGYRGASYGYRGYVPPGASNVVGTRGYVGQGGRASVGVGGRGFYSPYWGAHNYYYYHHGYYNTYYAPRVGFTIGFLPYGYYPFYFDDDQYFYSNGLFYTYDDNEYTVVEPPLGAEVNELPSNAQPINIDGQQYYEANGVYYEPIVKDDGSTSYQVAGRDGELNTNNSDSNLPPPPQVGDVVSTLPSDCRKINLNGEKYYVSPDGYYFQEMRDQDNNKVYKVVGTPDEGPDDGQ
ncbi:MAG TPA: DUF6515 family protein [Mucilaginibacter sp.]|nr:DUF6515 family protein [Mucilaginibacter sp.]